MTTPNAHGEMLNGQDNGQGENRDGEPQKPEVEPPDAVPESVG